MNRRSSRRRFAETSALAGLGILIGGSSTVAGTHANSALTVGLVGCGRRGTFDAAYFAKNSDARVVAVCDIYDDMLARGKSQIPEAAAYRDFDALLSTDVDAVLLATPPHLRPEQFEAAVRPGSISLWRSR